MASHCSIPSSSLLLRTIGWAPLRRPQPQKLPSPAAMVTVMSSKPEAASAYAPPHPAAPAAKAHVAADGSPSKASLFFEEQIEKVIYRCRFLTIFGVLGSLMDSVLYFLKGTFGLHPLLEIWNYLHVKWQMNDICEVQNQNCGRWRCWEELFDAGDEDEELLESMSPELQQVNSTSSIVMAAIRRHRNKFGVRE